MSRKVAGFNRENFAVRQHIKYVDFYADVNDELVNYKATAEFYIRQHQEHFVIAKLKTNKPLTESDIKSLEEILWSGLGTKEEYEREYGEKPLGEFVWGIVGLDMNTAKEAFSEYLAGHQKGY